MLVQLQAADATKLACNFVKEVVKISKAYRKSISPSNCDVYEAFAQHAKALLFLDCLTPNEVHCLQQKAETLNFDTVPEVLPCSAQVAITITPTTKRCKQVTTLVDPYPTITLVEDSEHVSSQISFRGVSDCWTTVLTSTLDGGCTPTSCDEVFQGRIDLIKNYTLPNFISYEDAVISSIKLYETDNNGGIYTTHTVNLDPLTSPYYAGTVNPDDVKLGSPNFSTSFKALLNNFADTRPGIASTPHLIDLRVFNNTLQFQITAKHHAKRILGIDKNDARIVIKSPVYGFLELPSQGASYLTAPANYYGKVFIQSPCGTYTPTVSAQNIRINFNGAATNFNEVVLSSNKAIDPVVLINATKECNIVELKATYSTIGTVLSRQWNTSFNTNIYESDTILADRAGTYYFTVTLENGCSIYKEYVINSLPSQSLIPDDVLTT